jgi:hypothetical protein
VKAAPPWFASITFICCSYISASTPLQKSYALLSKNCEDFRLCHHPKIVKNSVMLLSEKCEDFK